MKFDAYILFFPLLQVAFDIEGQQGAYDWVMEKAGQLARWWRYHLTLLFLRKPNGETITTRPSSFADLITQEQWDEFVAIRQSDAFRAKSEKNKNCAASNPYPYLRGRDGYKDLEQDMVC